MSQRLDIREIGAGAPVLFLHGCPTPPFVLLPLAERIADARRGLLAALPGYGASPPLDGEDRLARLHELLETEMLRRGAGELAIVGFSSGAYHALALAARARLRVHTVVSLGGFCTLSAEEREGGRALVAAVRAGADLRDAFVARFLSPAFAAAHPAAVEEVRGWGEATAPAHLAAEIEALVGCEDLRPRLRDLPARVVCRVGEADLACPVAASQEIARCAPRATVEVVPGAGHALVHEDLAGTAASLRRALGLA